MGFPHMHIGGIQAVMFQQSFGVLSELASVQIHVHKQWRSLDASGFSKCLAGRVGRLNV